jgi:hypothetical protein
MSDCCCGSKTTEGERAPQGWQCPCCRVVYAPTVDACYCCVEDLEIAPDASEIAPPVPPGPPVSTNPWHFTIQPPPSYSGITVTCEAYRAEG